MTGSVCVYVFWIINTFCFFPSPEGISTFTTLVCRTRVFYTCRRTSKLSPVCSWTQTPSPRTGRLLYKVLDVSVFVWCSVYGCSGRQLRLVVYSQVTRSLRMASTWRTAPARAALTGLRSSSCAWTALYFWRTDWRGLNSPACPGLTTGRDSSITLILSRRARVTVNTHKHAWCTNSHMQV